jgi:hypothetical protein
MPGKMARSEPRPSVRLPEVLIAVSTSRLSCKRAGKTRTLMPVWDSSGESRLKGRDWLGSLRIALTNPRAAVLLRLPVNARLRRLASWRRAGKSADHLLAAELSRLVHPLGRGIEPQDEVKEAWESHMHLTAAPSAEPRK